PVGQRLVQRAEQPRRGGALGRTVMRPKDRQAFPTSAEQSVQRIGAGVGEIRVGTIARLEPLPHVRLSPGLAEPRVERADRRLETVRQCDRRERLVNRVKRSGKQRRLLASRYRQHFAAREPVTARSRQDGRQYVRSNAAGFAGGDFLRLGGNRRGQDARDHSMKMSAVNVKTWVAGSRQLPGANPALWQTALRNASGVNPCSVATCGNNTACAWPRRTSSPSRPITRRHRSPISTWTGSASTEIPTRSEDSSSNCTGGNRGSERAADTATCRTTSPSGRSPRTCPMQPRRSWVSRFSSVTNAPRCNITPGTSGNSGGARPQSAASIARRASASSAARSA